MSKKRNKKYRPKPVINIYRRFDKSDQVDMNLKHEIVFAAILGSNAKDQDLLDLAHIINTYASLVDDVEGAELFSQAHILLENMTARFKQTGRVGMSGEEMQYTRQLMDWIGRKVETVPPEKLMIAIRESNKQLERAWA